jgi:hypothetical protein
MWAIRKSARIRPEALCSRSRRAGQRLLRRRLGLEEEVVVGASMTGCPREAADEREYERRLVA